MDDPTGLKRTGSGMYNGGLSIPSETPLFYPLDSTRYTRSPTAIRAFRNACATSISFRRDASYSKLI